MSKLAVALAAALAIGTTAQAWAQGKDEAVHASGVVKRLDAGAGVVNIAHDPVPALKWPAMTMDFKVKDKKLLESVKPEQRIMFSLVNQPGSGYVISHIEPAAKK
ncbi:MAG: copper-binding protein [Pseudomonadota bacterium]